MIDKEDNHTVGVVDSVPLVVDLDGTFLRTDLLFEAVVMLFKKNPLYLFLVFFWALQGKCILKQNIFSRVEIHYGLLPVHHELIAFLHQELERGRKLVLATASPQEAAERVAELYPLFSEIFGSRDGINLKGSAKAELLLGQYGQGQFDYIGNDRSDLAIFSQARNAYLVNAPAWVEKKARKGGNLLRCWQPNAGRLATLIRASRVYQWLKNVLLFVPLGVSHSFFELQPFLQVSAAFVAYSLIASAGYLINDILDLADDRSHPRKKNRPLASGDMPLLAGITSAATLLAVGALIAVFLDATFCIIVLLYFLGSMVYSCCLKKLVLYDVFLLAAFYTVRVIAGAVVIHIPVSFWLVAFSVFFFLSLAFLKRFAEVSQVQDTISLSHRRRDYAFADLPLIQIMGVASGFLSVVVFALYIDSPEVTLLYARPWILWILSFMLMFWISRIWLAASRGNMTDDPILFTLQDRTSYVILLLTLLVMLAAH